MWKLTAALLLTPVLALTGNPAEEAKAPLSASENSLQITQQSALTDWEQSDNFHGHSAHPAVSRQAIAMIVGS